jgi:cytoskeletal protein RodZ
LQRGLTIDEAAHATKLRPDKIAALESDDYSRFANNIYAKGFLQIYGKFLKVDVEDFARTLDNANPISISDYQYLTNAPAAKPETVAVRRDERRPPSLAPLFVFILFVAAVVGAVMLYPTIRQVAESSKATPAPGGGEPKATPNPDADFIRDPAPLAVTPATPIPQAITPIPQAITPRPNVATPLPAPRIAPATPAGAPPMAITPAPVAGGSPRAVTPGPVVGNQRTTPQPLIGAMTPRATPPNGIPAATPATKPPEQDFVTPAPVAAGDNATRPSGVNEVAVATIKKTWVTVRRDDPKAPPIFEDFVYPNTTPLKLKGARFFIEAKDPSAVQITKNGLPFAYQSTGGPVPVQ